MYISHLVFSLDSSVFYYYTSLDIVVVSSQRQTEVTLLHRIKTSESSTHTVDAQKELYTHACRLIHTDTLFKHVRPDIQKCTHRYIHMYSF